jgi:hypothetical protein
LGGARRWYHGGVTRLNLVVAMTANGLATVVAAAIVFGAVPAHAFVLESVAPARWQASDAELGFSHATVETFEDTALAPGLTYQVQSRASPNTAASATLPALFDPTTDTFGDAFANSTWDGTRNLISTADNQSHTYTDASQWGRQTFFFAGGAARVGFSLTNVQKALTLQVNGTTLGTVPSLAGATNVALAYGRNGYLIVTAEVGERIESITLENATNGDGWALDHLLIEWTASAVAFFPDDRAGLIHRYLVTPTGAPVGMGSIPASAPAGVAVAAGGQLFATDNAHSTVQWFPSPQGGATTPAGSFVDARLQWPEEMRFVDGELWVTAADAAGSSVPMPILRLGLDGGGVTMVVGTITTNLTGANRGLLWLPATRELFVSQCCATSALQHFRVAADRSTTALPAITGNGLANPHGMVMTSWGELLVANYDSNSVLRFVVDGNGGVRATGAITGNGLAAPTGMVLMSWGELLVVNQASGTVSRFTFDAAHAPVASGTFTVAAVGASRIGWIAVAPLAAACAPANSPACRGSAAATDAPAMAGPPTTAPARATRAPPMRARTSPPRPPMHAATEARPPTPASAPKAAAGAVAGSATAVPPAR